MVEQSAEYIRACYDAVAREYADRFAGELGHKPLDRGLLSRFATEVCGRGEVCDLGCGPGQTTAYLHGCGVRVCGLDVSAELLREAARLHPGVAFEQGDMLALPRADGTFAGVVAFYATSIFHRPSCGGRWRRCTGCCDRAAGSSWPFTPGRARFTSTGSSAVP